MTIQNPLLIYKAWFTTLPMTLADHVAHSVFLALTRYEPLSSLRLSWDLNSQSTQYQGVWAVQLFDILNQQVQLKQEFINQQLAVILLCATRMSLQKEGQQQLTSLEFKRTQYIKNLLMGNLEQAAYFEQELQKGVTSLGYKNYFQELQESGFNFSAIHNYLIKNA